MKKNLLSFIIIPLIILFGSCEKEDDFGDFDLNGDGKIEKIGGGYHIFGSSGYDLFSSKKLNDSTYSPTLDSIYRLSEKPQEVSFYDFDLDGDPDMIYKKFTPDSVYNYLLENKDGKFEEKPKLIEKEKRK
jgi:hypothetical protein